MSVNRDFFFLIFIAQVIVYTIIVPYTQRRCVLLIAASIALFIIPLCASYIFLRLQDFKKPTLDLPLPKFSFSILILFALALQISGSIVELLYGFQDRRIGTEVAAKLVSNIPIPLLAIMRLKDLYIFPIVTFLLFGGFRTSLKRIDRINLGLLFLIIIINAAFNSRAFFVLLFVFVFGLILHFRRLGLNFALVWRFGLGAIICVYALLFTANLRWASNDLFNPIASFHALGPKATEQWIMRLDGLLLIEEAAPSLAQKGFYWGELWINPVVATFGGIIGDYNAILLKAAARTTAKSQILKEQTTNHLLDFPSSMLTDLYGNFGFWAFPFAGIVLGTTFFFALRGLRGSLVTSFVSYLVIIHSFLFEQEFINFAIGWTRYIPLVIVFYFCVFLKLTATRSERY